MSEFSSIVLPAKRTLFEIGAELQALDALLEDLGGDVSDPEVGAAVDLWYASLMADEGRKLEDWVGYVRQLEMEVAVAREEAERFLAKARSRESRIEWLKGAMKKHLELTGRTKATTVAGRTLAVQKNGGKAPMVWVTPEGMLVASLAAADIPDEFCVTRRTIDMEKVRAALEAGQQLPFAKLEERGTHLRIR